MREWITQRFGAHTYTSTQQFNEEIEQYIQYLYSTAPDQCQLPKYLGRAEHAVLGLHHFHRNLHGLLRISWESLKTWSLGMPVFTRVPVLPEISQAIVLYVFVQGFLVDPPQAIFWLPFAVAVIFLTEFLARPGELFTAR